MERDMLVLKTWSAVVELVSRSAVMKVMVSKGVEELVGGSIFARYVWTSVGVGDGRTWRCGVVWWCRCRDGKKC